MMTLEKQHRVGIADRRQQHPFGVGGSGRHGDLQTGKMNEGAVVATRVARSAAGAGGELGADHHGNVYSSAGHIMITRRVRRQLIHRQRQQIGELNFDDRAHAVDRGANRQANQRGFGDRCVEDALFAELLDQAAGDTVSAAKQRDILAHDKHALIARHLGTQRLAQRFLHAQLFGCNCRCCISHGSPRVAHRWQ